MNMDQQEIIRSNNDRVRKRDAKEKRKEKKNLTCSTSELCKVNMLGTLLQFYNNVYVICPICANFMQLTSEYFTKDGFTADVVSSMDVCIHRYRANGASVSVATNRGRLSL